MATPYDVIVVGARCAGSPTAMLLARKGYRVLVVDRATFPSDTVSTHVIHAPGVAATSACARSMAPFIPNSRGVSSNVAPYAAIKRRRSTDIDSGMTRISG